jgi:hypothetical protein
MQADGKKFEEVWCMNEEECKELVTTLIEADRTIHEQQLGMQYLTPDLLVLILLFIAIDMQYLTPDVLVLILYAGVFIFYLNAK